MGLLSSTTPTEAKPRSATLRQRSSVVNAKARSAFSSATDVPEGSAPS